MKTNDDFRFVLPAELSKSADGEWRVKGRASTESKDRQGEIILQKGVDLTPIDQKKGYFNFDHLPGVENLLGVIDSYQKIPGDGIYVEGRLFKNHTKAKSVYEIMSSMNKADMSRIGLSVEGKVLERDPKNPKIIRKCQIRNVAITLNPVNTDTYADLIKSMSSSDIQFEATEENSNSTPATVENNEPTFTASQVLQLLQKAMGMSAAPADMTPTQKTGGDALAPESCVEEPTDVLKKKKSLKKMCKSEYMSNLSGILEKIQELYPQASKDDLWAAIKTRINHKFPEINQM